MTDLPIPVASAAPVARAAAANVTARGAPERDGATQPSTTAFQDALAQEVGGGSDGQTLPGLSLPATAAKADMERKAVDDAAQVNAAADGAPAFVNLLAQEFSLGPDGQALPGSDVAATAAKADTDLKANDDALRVADAVSERVSLPVMPTDAPVIAPAVARASDFVAPLALQGASVLRPTHAQSGAERAMPAADPREAPLPQRSVAARSDAHLSAAPSAADFAVPAKFLPAAAAELRREVTFDRSLLEQAPPTASAAIHAYAAPAQLTQVPTAALNPAVGEHGWNQGLGDQLVWMANQKHQVAELHLNPPDLGPLKITLTLDNDKASAQFFSAHAVVREAIETAMPRLREMLADNGITLGNVNVSAEPFRDPAPQQEQRHEPRAYHAPDTTAADPATVTHGAHLLRLSRGLVDTFA